MTIGAADVGIVIIVVVVLVVVGPETQSHKGLLAEGPQSLTFESLKPDQTPADTRRKNLTCPPKGSAIIPV